MAAIKPSTIRQRIATKLAASDWTETLGTHEEFPGDDSRPKAHKVFSVEVISTSFNARDREQTQYVTTNLELKLAWRIRSKASVSDIDAGTDGIQEAIQDSLNISVTDFSIFPSSVVYEVDSSGAWFVGVCQLTANHMYAIVVPEAVEVLISSTASATTIALADELSALLDTMYSPGSSVDVSDDLTRSGIHLGTYTELGLSPSGTPDYYVKSTSGGMEIAGVDTDMMRKAMWRYFRVLGYRQYQPGSLWEVKPTVENALPQSINQVVQKAFRSGVKLGISGGVWAPLEAGLDDWRDKNEIAEIDSVNTGHVWQAWIASDQAAFDANPTWNSSEGDKISCYEPGVQAVAIDFIKGRYDSLGRTFASVSASDGDLGWDLSGNNEHLTYTPSDRSIKIANAIMDDLSVNPPYDDIKLGMLLYGETAYAPVAEEVEYPDSTLLMATKGYYPPGITSVSQVIDNWQAKGGTNFGIYFYWEIFQWNYTKPGQSSLCDPAKISSWCNELLDSRDASVYPFVGGESGPVFGGTYGLGQYAWSVLQSKVGPITSTEARNVYYEAIDRLYPETNDIMREYHDLSSAQNGVVPTMSTDLFHRLYEKLEEALNALTSLTGDEALRIAENIKYVRWCELLYLYEQQGAGTTAQLDAYDALIEWTYWLRNNFLIHYKLLVSAQGSKWRHQDLEDRYGITLSWNTLDASPPSAWTDDPPDLTPSGLLTLASARKDANPTLPFSSRSWPSIEEDGAIEPVADGDARSRGIYSYFRPDQNAGFYWYLYQEPGNTTFRTNLRGGHFSQSSDDCTLNLIDLKTETAVATITFPADNIEREYEVTVTDGQTYRLEFADLNQGVSMRFWNATGTTTGTYNICYSPAQSTTGIFVASVFGYFYVPEGTTEIGGYWTSATSKIKKPDGTIVHTASQASEYFHYELSESEIANDTGKIWKIETNGAFWFMTVPNYIAFHPDELIVPTSAVP